MLLVFGALLLQTWPAVFVLVVVVGPPPLLLRSHSSELQFLSEEFSFQDEDSSSSSSSTDSFEVDTSLEASLSTSSVTMVGITPIGFDDRAHRNRLESLPEDVSSDVRRLEDLLLLLVSLL